jgi:hypothetical protein
MAQLAGHDLGVFSFNLNLLEMSSQGIRQQQQNILRPGMHTWHRRLAV